jgi:hypothetical protein
VRSRGGYGADGEYRSGILEGDRADCGACWERGDCWGAEDNRGPDQASEELDGHGCVSLGMGMVHRVAEKFRMHEVVLGRGLCTLPLASRCGTIEQFPTPTPASRVILNSFNLSPVLE